MGLPATLWDNLSFSFKVGITCGAVSCTNFQTSSLHQIGSTVHFLTYLAIDEALVRDTKTDLLGPFAITNADMEALRVQKTIYLPTPIVGFFLERDLAHTEAWTCLRVAIMDAEQKVDCRPILDWPRVALTKNVGGNKFPLSLPRPTAPLVDGDPILHLHHILNGQLPRLDPALQRVQGSLIATHIGEVAMKILWDREAKAQAIKSDV